MIHFKICLPHIVQHGHLDELADMKINKFDALITDQVWGFRRLVYH